jgi:hypothetical protein
MIVFWGTQLYGKVDKVPMLGHVATQFFYLQFVPLVPMASYLVLENGQGHIPVSFSFKSMLVAWLRTACVLGAIGLSIAGAIAVSDQHLGGGILCWVAAVGCATAMIASYYLPIVGSASYERAMALADQVGVTLEFRLTLEVAYGRKTAQQAEQELAQIYEAAQRELAQRQDEMQRMEVQRQAQMVNPFAQDLA